MSAVKPSNKNPQTMKIPGLHLTQIGSGDFLLEPSRGLNIHDRGTLIRSLVARLQHTKTTRLYYDLSEQVIIDPVYYAWLNELARALLTINIKMICIHMQPTAAFALAQFTQEPPTFGTALNISGWRKAGDRGQHDQRRPG